MHKNGKVISMDHWSCLCSVAEGDSRKNKELLKQTHCRLCILLATGIMVGVWCENGSVPPVPGRVFFGSKKR